MKKNTLNTAVLASLAGIAGIANISSAVNLNNDGTGQVLIYPYYTVNAGNQTLLSVVNTTNLGKAVKVRIIEGRNSREVLDFNLYLSPQDVWTASIFDTDNTGPGAIITGDNSCTAPRFAQSGETLNGIPFVSFFNFAYIAPAADGGPTNLERTREGYVEIIEMGTIIAGSELAGYINHKNGVPPGCNDVSAIWAGFSGTGTEPFAASISPASGGLFGGGAVVNSANGTYINYTAQALDGFYTTSNHTPPDSLLPSLRSATPRSLVFNNGQLITSTWATGGEDAVSSVFMSELLFNEFTTETALNAASEWVVTFPTKRFYVDAFTAGAGVPFRPFTRAFTAGSACEALTFDVRDREEGRPTTSVGFSPQPPGALPNSLCFEVNVLSFSQAITNTADNGSSPSRILGSNLTRNLSPTIGTAVVRAGWLNVNLGNNPAGTGATAVRRLRASVEGNVFTGLPVTGFWAVSIENNNASPGVKGFYGGAYDHKRGRRCDRFDANGVVNGTCF